MRYSLLGTTGMNLSHVSYGAAAIGSVWHLTDRAESVAAVHAALAAGVNYIDTAPWYPPASNTFHHRFCGILFMAPSGTDRV